jgi:hypothetical protein
MFSPTETEAMRFYNTVEILSLDGDGSFRANRGLEKLLKPSGIKTTSWGDRQVDRLKFAAAFASRGAPWRPGAAQVSRGAGDALRGAGKLRERRESGLVTIACPLRRT